MPVRAAAAATCLVWFDCTPPIETSVSQPFASASATRYSSLRVLLPPKARPLLQSSRLAQSVAPPRWDVSRSSWCTGDGPNISGCRWNESSLTWSSSGSRRQPLDLPAAPASRPVHEAVVQAVGAVLPELEPVGDHPE